MRLLSMFLLLLLCVAWPVRAGNGLSPGTVWVVAPHPDDEVLMAAEALAQAVRTGRPYEVAIVTNGDFGCSRNGWARQEESIAALATLGVTEDHVHFLGYPDGWLARLGAAPLAPVERAARDGTCGTGNTTYGRRGHERRDVHTARTGAPAPYTDSAVVDDLSALFAAAPPREIHLPHAIDEHPDHAMTYAYVRRALAQHKTSTLLVRHVVHAGPCWPASDAVGACIEPTPALSATPLPPLPPPWTALSPDRSERTDPTVRRTAIAHYESQLDGPLDTSWLTSFARTTEISWLEPIVRGEPRRRRATQAVNKRYRVRITDHTIELLRTDGGGGSGDDDGERVLRRLPTSLPANTALTLRVSSDNNDNNDNSGGGVVIEVHGPQGFVLGTPDPFSLPH